jgi:hypothetical protein
VDGTFALSTIGKSMEKFHVCITLKQPLLPTPLPPVVLFSTQHFHHLALKMIAKGPTIFIKAYSISQSIKLLNVSQQLSFSLLGILSKVGTPPL